MEKVSVEWLHAELRSSLRKLIILDCRSSTEFSECHIRSAVNFSIPSILLRRLNTGKMDLSSTIKSKELKNRLKDSENIFVLYNCINSENIDDEESQFTKTAETIINVLHKKLKQDQCRVVILQDGFTKFQNTFPEWCDFGNPTTGTPVNVTELMGLRSLRISSNISDCGSSESSDESVSIENCSNIQPIEIIPGLFLGNAMHSEDLPSLERNNIKFIMNVTPNLPNVFEGKTDIEYLKIPIIDHWSEDCAAHFPAAIRFIDKARAQGSSVLVHCLAGVSRSVTITLAYLMQSKCLSLNDAFTQIKNKKSDISPNFHFMEQLHTFEQYLNKNRDPNLNLTTNVDSDDIVAKRHCDAEGNVDDGSVGGDGGIGDTGGEHDAQITHSKTCSKCIQAQFAKSGISPDSGIEFDRWTSPGNSSTPKLKNILEESLCLSKNN